jgi:RNA polymerase sigma-70 factor (ECF subfamily)
MLAFMPWTPRPATPAEDDATLARRAAAHDAQALESIYRRNAPAVYRYALALGGNPVWAADATQAAFVALVERKVDFDPARGSLAACLAGVARHHLLVQWRERAWPDDDVAPAELDEASPEELLVARQDVQSLRAAMARLPWPQREAIVLVDLQQRSYEEAAAIAGVELNTLRTRLHRGRARLAQWLAEPTRAPDGANTT